MSSSLTHTLAYKPPGSCFAGKSHSDRLFSISPHTTMLLLYFVTHFPPCTHTSIAHSARCHISHQKLYTFHEFFCFSAPWFLFAVRHHHHHKHLSFEKKGCVNLRYQRYAQQEEACQVVLFKKIKVWVIYEWTYSALLVSQLWLRGFALIGTSLLSLSFSSGNYLLQHCSCEYLKLPPRNWSIRADIRAWYVLVASLKTHSK